MAKQHRNKKKKGGRVVFLIEILVLLLLIGGIFVFARVTNTFENFYHASKEKNEQQTGAESGEDAMLVEPEIEVNSGVLDNEILSNYHNIALIGLDTRTGNLDHALSDTMLIASINNDTQSVRMISLYRDTYLNVGDERYSKANSAYSYGSHTQLLSMLNRNLDLALTDYVVVDFNAVAQIVDDLGGLDITMTSDEVMHMNNYCVETSEVTGKSYTRIEPEVEGTYHLNGVQSVAYARIRYTTGNDFKRTQRQRLVIEKIIEKAKSQGVNAFAQIADDVFPMIKTNLSKSEIVKLGSQIFGYQMEKTGGFPFAFALDTIDGGSVIVPVTLYENVRELHEWLYDETDYMPSDTVRQISDSVAARSGYGEGDIEQARKTAAMANPDMGSEADQQ